MRIAWNEYICHILSYLSHVSYCVVRKSWLIASMRKKSCYRHNWIFGEYPLLFIEIQYTTCYIFLWISFFFWYVYYVIFAYRWRKFNVKPHYQTLQLFSFEFVQSIYFWCIETQFYYHPVYLQLLIQ